MRSVVTARLLELSLNWSPTAITDHGRGEEDTYAHALAVTARL